MPIILAQRPEIMDVIYIVHYTHTETRDYGHYIHCVFFNFGN